MENRYLKTVILYCLQKLGGQRTIYSILHLLNGKKSSQTIQDAHLFQLTPLFRTFPSLSRMELDNLAAEMEKQKWIQWNAEQQYYLVTAEGSSYLKDSLESHPIPADLNGWKFHHFTDVFWERLSLLVQVISHLNHHNPRYLPIQRKKEVHTWLKFFLLKTEVSREDLGIKLYQELAACLEANKAIDPSILVLRLTGYYQIGLTAQQAAERLGMNPDYYHYQFLGILHYIAEMMKQKPDKFFILNKLIADSENTVPLTHSSKKTFTLLNKGFKTDEIAQIRRLKRSTIEDHIVEIVLNISHFDISPFVDQDRQETILTISKRLNSRQLKHIRQQIPEADYFEIRLVLAKFGEVK